MEENNFTSHSAWRRDYHFEWSTESREGLANWGNISGMRRRVEDTARSGVFLTNFEVSNASYHFSNKTILEGETKDAKINSFLSDFQILID